MAAQILQEKDSNEKKVKFDSKVKVRLILLTANEEEHKKCMWYSREDCANMRQGDSQLRKKLTSVSTVDEAGVEMLSYLGLLTVDDIEEKLLRTVIAEAAVFGEQTKQETQFMEGNNDGDTFFILKNDKIRERYSIVSQEASSAALQRGQKHSQHVQELLKETETEGTSGLSKCECKVIVESLLQSVANEKLADNSCKSANTEERTRATPKNRSPWGSAAA